MAPRVLDAGAAVLGADQGVEDLLTAFFAQGCFAVVGYGRPPTTAGAVQVARLSPFPSRCHIQSRPGPFGLFLPAVALTEHRVMIPTVRASCRTASLLYLDLFALLDGGHRDGPKETRPGAEALPVLHERGLPSPAFVDYKDVPTLKKLCTHQGKLMTRKRYEIGRAHV